MGWGPGVGRVGFFGGSVGPKPQTPNPQPLFFSGGAGKTGTSGPGSAGGNRTDTANARGTCRKMLSTGSAINAFSLRKTNTGVLLERRSTGMLHNGQSTIGQIFWGGGKNDVCRLRRSMSVAPCSCYAASGEIG